MAKPGSNGARRIAGVPDLSRAAMSDAQAWEVQGTLELASGWRCSGCGRRIAIGFQFTSLDVTDPHGPPVIHLAACTRDDCDFVEKAKAGATVMKMIEFAWLDEAGLDAPAIKTPFGAAPDG